jgi:HSP20 family protein
MARMLPVPRHVGLATEVPVDFYNIMDDFFSGARGRFTTADLFKVDVQENDEGYLVQADLPGVKKENVDIEMNEEKLTIEVKAEEIDEETEKNYIHRERRACSMARGVYLKGSDADGISAKLEDGVLTIKVPLKAPVSNVRKISLE